MKQETWDNLKKGANLVHKDGSVGIFDQLFAWKDTALVFKVFQDGTACPQLWTIDEVLD